MSDPDPVQKRPIVGIDLGTTNSLVAVFEDGRPRLLPNAAGDLLTPSVVGVLPDGSLVVGAAARELRVTAPERCVSFFKRWIGTDRALRLGDREFSAVELSSLVLASLKADAMAALGVQKIAAVITVPAYFNEHQREATRLAGELAGLEVLRTVNEPTAAALTYGFHEADAEKRLLVFDLGGGTFDVTLMEIFEGNLEIQATAGESQLGGEDFTDQLTALLLEERGMQPEAVALGEPLRYARLRESAEIYKRSPSPIPVAFPDAEGRTDGTDLATPTEAQFEAAVGPLLDRLENPVLRVLRDARLAAEDLDEVLLVGGASQQRFVVKLVERLTGRAPNQAHDPDHVVALGAAVQAALIADDAAVSDLIATDVAPHTLGVEIMRDLGGQLRDGYFMPVVHRNTTIPVAKEVQVSTVHAGQTTIKLRVFQGESRHVEDNLELGLLEVKGIPAGPPGQPLTVRFAYDSSGLLDVEAIIVETGKRFSVSLDHRLKNLSPAERLAAAKRLAAVKFYPREETTNIELMAFANRIVGELDRFRREQLEEFVDDYEDALWNTDKIRFKDAREQLLQVLSGLGFPFRPDGKSA